MKAVFATKDEMDHRFTNLEQKVNTLDFKQEDMDIKLDAFLDEILDSRNEQKLQSATISDHADQLESHGERINVLEKRHSSNPSPVFPALS